MAENAGANINMLARQYVSDAIQAGDITGTVKGIIRASEATTAQNSMPQIVIYVVSNDGTTVRGQLIAFNNAALSNEFVLTTLTNRKYPRNWSSPGTTVTTVTASANDRVVIEIGARTLVGGEGLCTVNLGDTGATDCAEDETSTTANVPWIEFSHDLFAAASGRIFKLVGSGGGLVGGAGLAGRGGGLVG